jgi:hypothetical protein
MLPCRQTGYPARSPEIIIHIGIQSKILSVSPWNCNRAGKKIPAQLVRGDDNCALSAQGEETYR